MKKYNKLSIIGFVISLLIGTVGIIISIISLNQIKKTKEKGKSFAVSGVLIGIVKLIIVILFIITVILNSKDEENNIKSKAPILATAISYKKQITNITNNKLKDGSFEKNRIYIYDMANDFSDAESGYVVVDTSNNTYYIFIYDINFMILNKSDLEIESVEKLNKKKWNKSAGSIQSVCKSVSKNKECYYINNERIS